MRAMILSILLLVALGYHSDGRPSRMAFDRKVIREFLEQE
jgi:hypothetical protein